MKNLKIFGFILLAFCLTTKTYSQGSVSFHAGTAIPLLEFADDNTGSIFDGGAAVGFNAGLQYVYRTCSCGVGIFGGIDFNYNALQKDFQDNIKQYFNWLPIHTSDFKFRRYINIPVTAGLNYSYDPGDKIGVFVYAGLALDFQKLTDMEIQINGHTGKEEAGITTGIGYKIGGGILILKKVSLSVDYLALGTHDVHFDVKSTNASGSPTDHLELKVDMLTVGLGYRF